MPGWIEPLRWATPEQLVEFAPEAEIGWFDLHEKPPVLAAIEKAAGLRWLNTSYAGVDWLPLADLAQRGVALTCGTGLTTQQVAEFAVLGMLAVALEPSIQKADADRLVDSLRLSRIGASWGGYESLALTYPTIHGWNGGALVRLNIGLEDPADLIADLGR